MKREHTDESRSSEVEALTTISNWFFDQESSKEKESRDYDSENKSYVEMAACACAYDF